jgi:hypothetical protein
MFAKLKMFFIFVVLLCAGCQTNLVIEEGIPKMHKPLPKETKVFLVGPALENADVQFERSPAKITRAFKKGLSDFGIDVLTPKKRLETKEAAFDEAKKNKCDVILYVTIESWGYADAGFSGIGARDEIVLKVMFINPETQRVLERASVMLVNSFFKKRMVNINETSAANLLEGFTRKFFDVENKINDAD